MEREAKEASRFALRTQMDLSHSSLGYSLGKSTVYLKSSSYLPCSEAEYDPCEIYFRLTS